MGKWLKKKIILYISALFLVVLSIIMTILYYAIQDTLYDNAKESSFSIANSIYMALDEIIFSSAQLATFIGNDPFITNDLNHTEITNPDKISSYIKNIKNIYGYDIVHIASFSTNKIYGENGLITTFSENNTEDQWFFDIINESHEVSNYRPLVVNDNQTVIFNNIYVIKDASGNKIGLILIGLDYSSSLGKIKSLISALDASVFVINKSGEIDNLMLDALNNPIQSYSIESIDLTHILSNSNENLVQIIDNNRSVSFKYIEELDSYLVIIQDLSTSILYIFIITLLIVVLVLAFILLITLKFIDYSNRKILDEASLDPLTQIYNRSVFNYKLNEALELCVHYNITSSFIFVDIDDFKRINDEMGHSVGDEIIVKVAQILNDTKRKNDVLFRWGGDEFGLIVRSNLESAKLLAERILINSNQIYWKDNTPIHLSIGVTEILCSDTKKHVFNRVDEALYQAKENGKNQVFAKTVSDNSV